MELGRDEYADLLQAHSVRPTSNRILILRTLRQLHSPVSLKGLETLIETIDKSILSRTLALFREHRLVHAIEGSEGIMLFEACRGGAGSETDDDEHVHFYCTGCHKTFCLSDTPVPTIKLPEGFTLQSVNCVVKGICKDCLRKLRRNLK
ncbi:MAG: transcriptional repressor [Prevotellaceae bacterium]|nr:transcriptional repressor [Prevotellaceae bacterium]MCD8303454.1 transcriptional repressor [Prevotellaceae bacterium]